MQDGRSTGVDGSDGSVMFSLRELRGLEIERIEDELVADRRQRARQEEARLAAAEAEAARIAAAARAEIERAQAVAEERERHRRQNELALIAIEARLDREEEEQLDAVRRAAEAQAAIDIKRASPWGKVAGVIGAAMLCGGITVALLIRSGSAELARAEAAADAQTIAARQAVERSKQAEVARFTAQLAGLQSQLQAAGQRELAAAELRRQLTPRRRRVATAGASRPEAKSPASAAVDPAAESILDNL
jgi:hypothetical protein